MKLLFIIMAVSAFEIGIGMFCGRVIHFRAVRDTVDPELDSRRTHWRDS